MDPDANLKEQLEIAYGIVNGDDEETNSESQGERLAELVIALHNWKSKGGFSPKAWRTHA